jgi:hypothetical protein
MAVMAADTAFTREDLDALPEDGRRHELLDGGYTERAHLTGNETVDLSSPYPVELSAHALRPA